MAPLIPRVAFILSMPRSGSTLLQRILTGSPDIASAPEPWLAVQTLSPYAVGGVFSFADNRITTYAAENFFNSHPSASRQDLLRGIGQAIEHVYGAYAGPERLFVDKTPRNALVMRELSTAFPTSPFIVLTRNPLAAAASIATAWGRGLWIANRHRVDLIGIPRELARAITSPKFHPGGVWILSYEDLTADPSREINALCDWLGVEPPDLSVDLPEALAGPVGDPTGQERWRHVESGRASEWKGAYARGFRRRWAARYLEQLGPDVMAALGYESTVPGPTTIGRERLPNWVADRAASAIWRASWHLDPRIATGIEELVRSRLGVKNPDGGRTKNSGRSSA